MPEQNWGIDSMKFSIYCFVMMFEVSNLSASKFLCHTLTRPTLSTQLCHIKYVPVTFRAWSSSIADSDNLYTDKYFIFYPKAENCVHLRNFCLTSVNSNFGIALNIPKIFQFVNISSYYTTSDSFRRS